MTKRYSLSHPYSRYNEPIRDQRELLYGTHEYNPRCGISGTAEKAGSGASNSVNINRERSLNSNVSPGQMEKSAVDDLLVAREAYKDLVKGYNQRRYELIAVAATAVASIMADESEMRKFRSHEYWESENFSKKMYLNVMKFLTSAKGEASKKIASKHAICGQYLVEVLKLSRDDFPKTIKKMRGIQAIARLASASKASQDNTKENVRRPRRNWPRNGKISLKIQKKQGQRLASLNPGQAAELKLKLQDDMSFKVVKITLPSQ